MNRTLPFSVEEVVVWSTCFSAVIIVCLALNGIVLLGILTDKTVRSKPSSVFLVSILISRSLIAVFVIPAKIWVMYSEDSIGLIGCRSCLFGARWSSTTTILLSCILAVFLAKEAVDRQFLLSRRRAVQFNVGIWVVGFIYSLKECKVTGFVHAPTVISTVVVCVSQPQYSELGFKLFIADYVFIVAVPVTFLAACLAVTLYGTRVSNPHKGGCNRSGSFELSNSRATLETGDFGDLTHSEYMENSECKLESPEKPTPSAPDIAKMATTKIVLTVLFLFVVCYTPLFSFIFYIRVKKVNVYSDQVLFNLYQLIALLCYCNSWLNALLCLYYRSDIANSVRRLFQRHTISHA